MIQLVPVDMVRLALRINDDESDELLEMYIAAASRAVIRYLKSQASQDITIIDSPALDSPPTAAPDDLGNVDETVQMAVIALTGILYREPDGDQARNFAELGQLPYVVTALLYSMRDPALA